MQTWICDIFWGVCVGLLMVLEVQLFYPGAEAWVLFLSWGGGGLYLYWLQRDLLCGSRVLLAPSSVCGHLSHFQSQA